MTPVPVGDACNAEGKKSRQEGEDGDLLGCMEAAEDKGLIFEENEISHQLLFKDAKSPNVPACDPSGQLSLTQCLQRHLQNAVKYYLNNYVLLIMTAVFGQTLVAACTKTISDHVNVFQAVALRATVCSLLMFTTCRVNGISLTEPRKKLPLFFLRGVVGATAFVFLTLGWCELPLSESAFMTNSYPAVTAVLSWLIGMEDLGILSGMGAVGCLIGNALVARPPFLFGGDDDWDTGRIVGIIAAGTGNLFMGLTCVLLRYIGGDVNTIALTTYMNAFALLYSLPFMIAGYPMTFSTRLGVKELLCYGLICLSGMFGHPAMSRALQIGPPTKVTSIFMLNMLVSGFVGVVALHESVSWFSAIGATVIIISVILITAQGPRRPNQYEALPSDDQELEI